jgi:4-amino-4-deoxy-L-arabinose transferase-like glycosyltransferase
MTDRADSSLAVCHNSPDTVSGGRRWWLEWEVWLLMLLVGAIYLTRLEERPLTGEEPRRGQIAREMLWWNDWLVPRQQGLPFLSRPPVQNWIIAFVGLARGTIDEITIRLPSVVATLLCVLLIYGYCRCFLSRLGAFCAGAAYATMGLVLQFAWLGETEAIYTLFVGGSLLLWRWADATGRHALWGWIAGYGLAALGMLTKGPQAPAYFLGGVGLFLLLSRRWRELLAWPHFVGIALFLFAWGLWQIPFSLCVPAEDSWAMFSGDVALRFDKATWRVFCEHLAVFPLDILVCMLPWSVLLLAYASKDFRRTVAYADEHLRFLVCSIGVAFMSCWLVPGARNRYFAPLFLCVAPMIGLVVEQCRATAPWANLWRHYLRGISITICVVGLWVAAATVLGWGPSLGGQPAAFAVAYVASAAAMAFLMFWLANRFQPAYQRLAILGITAFLGVSYVGLVVNAMLAVRRPIPELIAEMKQLLPPNAALVSLGSADPIFCFYYGKPIRPIFWGQPEGFRAAPWTYFCMRDDLDDASYNFPHETWTVISTDPFYSPEPEHGIIVGQLLDPSATDEREASR